MNIKKIIREEIDLNWVKDISPDNATIKDLDVGMNVIPSCNSLGLFDISYTVAEIHEHTEGNYDEGSCVLLYPNTENTEYNVLYLCEHLNCSFKILT